MTLSAELLQLRDAQDEYVGDETLVGRSIQDKELHMLSGPTRVGKSTIIQRTLELMPESALGSSITDRTRKPGDPQNEAFITLTEGMTSKQIRWLIAHRRLVNYAVSPTGFIYGSLAEGYPARHNFLPTLTGGVLQLQKSAFKRKTHSYVTLSGNAWRTNIGSHVSQSRMEEGIVSLEYADEHMEELEFVRNRLGKEGLSRAAYTLMNIAAGTGAGDDKNKAFEDIHEMLAVAKDLAVRSK